jgi:hypothetical protein
MARHDAANHGEFLGNYSPFYDGNIADYAAIKAALATLDETSGRAPGCVCDEIDPADVPCIACEAQAMLEGRS